MDEERRYDSGLCAGKQSLHGTGSVLHRQLRPPYRRYPAWRHKRHTAIRWQQSRRRIVIEFKRRLNTGDRFDKAFTPGQSISVIWASSQDPDASIKHDVAYGEGILTLTDEQKTAALATTAAVLSLREKQGILFIWEEEKTARDLYTVPL